MPNARLKYLFDRHIAKTCTESERQELAVMILTEKHEEEIKDLLQQAWDDTGSTEELEEEKAENIIRGILTSEETSPPELRSQPSLSSHASQMERGAKTLRPSTPLRVTWKRIAAAAAVLLFVTIGGYYITTHKKNQDIVRVEPQETRFKNDVQAPSKAKAMITLADGSTVALDSVKYGKLASQGNVNVMVTADGGIVYKEQGSLSPLTVQYNTLSNPRGSTVIDMTLADGSRVWLNAGSSVTYPVAFIGTERNISITGEAYFEVTRNTAMPFKVSKGETTVTVLGTHFNVNAYDDEANIRVTLLEGSVRVSKGSSSGLLKPGQQAQVGSEVKIVNDVDVDAVIAWKNGLFRFKDATIEPIMRQIEKWYDVDVVFEDKVTEHFITTIPRKVPVTQVFKYLETTGRVRFKIDGRKVIVLK